MGHHLGSPPPAVVCGIVAANTLAQLIPEKKVIYPSVSLDPTVPLLTLLNDRYLLGFAAFHKL
jgi:hypothetical protein